MTSPNIPHDLYDAFLDKLLEEVKADTLPDSLYVKIKDKVSYELQARIGLLIATHMPEELTDQLNEVMDRENPEEIESFVYDNIEGFADLLLKELEDFREDYISGVNMK